MEAHDFPVLVTKSVSVYSNHSHNDDESILTLSNLDRQCPTLMYLIFFYKPTSYLKNSCLDSVFDRLKAGLEATLSTWYPAAGRLRFTGLAEKQQLNIWCNNAGAIMAQAVTPAKISDLGDLSCYSAFFDKLVFKPVFGNNDITEMPLVAAQVTRFECGGYSVGVGTSHSLFDGISAYDFFAAWASHNGQQQQQQQIVVQKPIHDRGRLVDHNSISRGGRDGHHTTAIEHLYRLIMQQQRRREEASEDDRVTRTDLVFKTFHLSADMMERFKKKVVLATDYDKKRSFSSFEVLAAHLWKVRNEALELERDRTVCLQFAVDSRNRMMPPLPEHFSGNAYVLASVLSTAGELQDQSLASTIDQIRKAKNSVNNDYVSAYITDLERDHGIGVGPPQHQEATAAGQLLPPELTVVSDWTRVPFHKIGFLGGNSGEGEAAEYASPLVPPTPQVAYFMQNPEESGAIDVRIGLLPRIQPAFSQHFMNFVI